MAKVLVEVAEEVTSCDRPQCADTIRVGDSTYPARYHDLVYCSAKCRTMHNKVMYQQRRRDNETTSTHDNFNRRFRKYGITREEFEHMYDLQLGRCAICQIPLSETRVHVDHCHSSQEVRGLLCNLCNPGLGYFQDDPALLRKAAEYLERAVEEVI